VSLYAKRDPWPFSLKISGNGYILGSPKPGEPALLSSKAEDISSVDPPGFEYANLSPLADREEPYEALVMGMGMRLQHKWQDYRYSEAMGVDCSVTPWCKGPEVLDSTGQANGEIVDFFEIGSTLYAAGGSQILRYTPVTNTWAVSHDFGAGHTIVAAVVFASNFDGIQRVWVGFGNGVPAQYSSDGTAFTAMATFGALAFIKIAREWWWADNTNVLRKCDTNADPTNEANYTALIFRVGDMSSPITSLMATAGGVLIIAKTDGLYTLDQAGDDHPLFPFLQYAPNARNGKCRGQFSNDLYYGYGTNLNRLGTDLGLEEIGPERLPDYDGPVRGQVTSFTGVGSMYALSALWNPDTNTSYLMKFGAFIIQGTFSTYQTLANVLANPDRIDAWHGSLNDGWVGKYPSRMTTTAIGAPAGHTFTLIGFSDGTIARLINPCVYNPLACSVYRFNVGDDWVRLPLWDGTYAASRKTLRSWGVTGPRIDAQNYLTLEYKTDPATVAWTDFGYNFQAGTFDRHIFPVGTVAILAQFRVHLHNTVNTASPAVSSVSIGHALRPSRIMTFEGDILCADGIVRRDGVPMRKGRLQIKSEVEAAVDDPGAVLCVLPDETSMYLSFVDYKMGQSFDEVGRQWRGSLHIKAVQWTAVEPPPS
jgi:hypothetical protein